jgi:hypothetical protein
MSNKPQVTHLNSNPGTTKKDGTGANYVSLVKEKADGTGFEYAEFSGKRLVVGSAIEGIGMNTHTLQKAYQGLIVKNLGTTNMTVRVNGIPLYVDAKSMEGMEVRDFTSVQAETTGSYIIYLVEVE